MNYDTMASTGCKPGANGMEEQLPILRNLVPSAIQSNNLAGHIGGGLGYLVNQISGF